MLIYTIFIIVQNLYYKDSLSACSPLYFPTIVRETPVAIPLFAEVIAVYLASSPYSPFAETVKDVKYLFALTSISNISLKDVVGTSRYVVVSAK